MQSSQGSRPVCLLVEDEPLIALSVELTLTDGLGIEMIGPVGRLAPALEIARAAPIDFALLDVRLHGERVYPVADCLVARRIPFAFHTGDPFCRETALRYPFATVFRKPIDHERLIEGIRRFMESTLAHTPQQNAVPSWPRGERARGDDPGAARPA